MCSGELPIGKGPALAERASNLGWMINGSCQYILIGVCDTECLDVQSRWLLFLHFSSDSWHSLDM